ncbi:hypothetical protein [Variovorax sp. V15]|uniref:hypothetical protein n=1 Tax=Variovorax sp. V15 TaxID=3065952 RepID=UPI0034E8A165
MAAAGGVRGAAYHPDATDAQLVKREEFACIRDSVLIDIAPDLDLAPCQIGASEVAIGIAVQVREGIEGIGRFLSVALDGVDAKEFSPGLNEAIAIEIAYEKAVIGAKPTGARFDAVGIVIKQD